MIDQKADIAAILKTLHAAFERRDMTTIGRYFDENIRFVTPEGEMQGKAARMADEERIFELIDDTHVDVTSVLVGDDEAIEICFLRGAARIGPNPGTKVALRYVVHYRFAGERIIFQEICFDRAALQAQLGLAA